MDRALSPLAKRSPRFVRRQEIVSQEQRSVGVRRIPALGSVTKTIPARSNASRAVLKFVVADEADLAFTSSVAREHPMAAVYVQPQTIGPSEVPRRRLLLLDHGEQKPNCFSRKGLECRAQRQKIQADAAQIGKSKG